MLQPAAGDAASWIWNVGCLAALAHGLNATCVDLCVPRVFPLQPKTIPTHRPPAASHQTCGTQMVRFGVAVQALWDRKPCCHEALVVRAAHLGHDAHDPQVLKQELIELCSLVPAVFELHSVVSAFQPCVLLASFELC